MERRQKRPLNWSTYNLKVLKQVHGAQNLGMSTKAMTVLNDMLWDSYRKIMREAETLVTLTKKSTINSRSIQTAVRLVVPGELGKHAVSEGTKSVTKYGGVLYDPDGAGGGHNNHNTNKVPKPKLPRRSRSAQVGLAFPVGRIRRKMQIDTKYRVSDSGAVYFAAVLEYLAAEILELSGNAARDNRKKRIIPRHVFLAIKNDDELNKFFGNYTIAGGGNMPAITVYFPTKIKTNNNNNDNNAPAQPAQMFS